MAYRFIPGCIEGAGPPWCAILRCVRGKLSGSAGHDLELPKRRSFFWRSCFFRWFLLFRILLWVHFVVCDSLFLLWVRFFVDGPILRFFCSWLPVVYIGLILFGWSCSSIGFFFFIPDNGLFMGPILVGWSCSSMGPFFRFCLFFWYMGLFIFHCTIWSSIEPSHTNKK